MLFNSIPFLVFFPVFFLFYYATSGRLRVFVCLLASYIFYGWWDWRFLGLLVISTLVDYNLGLLLENTRDERRRKQLLGASIFVNLGILGFFKYFDFFLSSLDDLLRNFDIHIFPGTIQIILPIGISFYTFQKLSYTIDVYKKKLDAEKDLIRFATFVAFFPQLVAGPIIRASHLLPQFRKDRQICWEGAMVGLAQIIWGFFKKIAVADTLSPLVSEIFSQPTHYSSLALVVGVLFFSIQIYCDFSGYSDIAIGIARLMGFHFPKNFNYPYLSRNFSQFWESWHISLSSWFRDYLYIPLGGNRYGRLLTFRNLMVTMLLGGLWHGANWTFVIWGGLHGFFLVLQRMLSPFFQKLSRMLHIPQKVKNIASITIVFVLTSMAWIFFRAQSLEDALIFFQGIAKLDWTFSSLPYKFVFAKGMMMISIFLLIEFIHIKTSITIAALKQPVLRILAFSSVLSLLALFGSFNAPFIYFQF